MKRKKLSTVIISALMTLTIAIGLVGCGQKSTSEDSAITFKAGTYEATAKGHNADLKLSVTVDETSIKEINILEHNESPGISDPAFEKVPNEIIETQSVNVDSVSGATVSSMAIITAVTEALKQSGVDIDALNKRAEGNAVEVEDIEKTTDVLVIGAGGAGMAAAVTAHQNGAEVLIIEKMGKVGGNTMISGTAYNAVDPVRQKAQGIEDSVEKHYEQTLEGGDNLGNPELVKTLTENAYSGIEWLESLGMQFKDEVFTVLGGLWPRAHKPVLPLGTGYFEQAYMPYLEENNVEVMLETKATELIVEDGKVVGVIAEGSKGNKVTIKANNGVILATGGFGANVEMRQEYDGIWGTLDESIGTTNHPGATGDGVVMAEAIGAELVGMDKIQLLPMGDPETGSLTGNIEQGVEDRIFINKEGNRFVDEGERRDVMTKALFEQTDDFMWIVVDQHSYPTGDTKNNFNETIDELVEAGRAYKADTLEELAEMMGVDKDNFINAVNKFNEAVDGAEDEFGRTLFANKIDTAPFYAAARKPTVHHTMGGVKINTNAEVVNTNGEVISGLFAAGEVTGGIHGSNRLGGNALADITVFGRIAGENAAKANK